MRTIDCATLYCRKLLRPLLMYWGIWELVPLQVRSRVARSLCLLTLIFISFNSKITYSSIRSWFPKRVTLQMFQLTLILYSYLEISSHQNQKTIYMFNGSLWLSNKSGIRSLIAQYSIWVIIGRNILDLKPRRYSSGLFWWCSYLDRQIHDTVGDKKKYGY